MRVDPDRLDVSVARHFLHRAKVVAVFQQVRSERMPQSMAGDALADSRHVGGLLKLSDTCSRVFSVRSVQRRTSSPIQAPTNQRDGPECLGERQ